MDLCHPFSCRSIGLSHKISDLVPGHDDITVSYHQPISYLFLSEEIFDFLELALYKCNRIHHYFIPYIVHLPWCQNTTWHDSENPLLTIINKCMPSILSGICSDDSGYLRMLEKCIDDFSFCFITEKST